MPDGEFEFLVCPMNHVRLKLNQFPQMGILANMLGEN
jgi:hypothetical protein